MAGLAQRNRTRLAPSPFSGQTAPKMPAEAVRRSFGAAGRLPWRAQRRGVGFFWPRWASSCHRSSTDALLVEADPKALEQPGGRVFPPPAHHAVRLQVRPFLDDSRQGVSPRIVARGPWAGLPALDQTIRPSRVEGQPPVAHPLQADRADPRKPGCGFRPRRSRPALEGAGSDRHRGSSAPGVVGHRHQSARRSTAFDRANLLARRIGSRPTRARRTRASSAVPMGIRRPGPADR